MKKQVAIAALLLVWNTHSALSQEWKNLKCYQKETGNLTLQQGCWLKKDRKKQNDAWKQANAFNISVENGNLKYKTISQIRDFYAWFDAERKRQGHEIQWISVAGIVTRQLSKLDAGIIRFLIVRNKEVVAFGNEGSQKVFEFAYPRLREVYFSKNLITGTDADQWDLAYGTAEQCDILEPLYRKLSPRALRKLDRMAKGKGLFTFGVPKKMRYVGSIEDCHDRVQHGMDKILPLSPSFE
ncbi:hypothetical protein [Flavobacterium humi]|uniref:Uncharacterized protein n=1 Tax=Flavobacterium humi TaxID=2562683 RepID=A0A4Z0L6N8_9FLAO|nr:hypothetical protein [Flavobacterium humi]TGD57953.1 hypothetical protein E4635_08045 [Flavobacterium humi]